MFDRVDVAPWPAPGKLKSVKSQNKPIFKAARGELKIGEHVSGFSNISVTGESRILAIGCGGSAVAHMLLAKQRPSSGEVCHVDGLIMVHLGPHLLGELASPQEHAAAIAVAMRVKPHIVVLEEALTFGSEAWVKVFDCILDGDFIKTFKGAVVVCVDVEEPGPHWHGCNERWLETSPGGGMKQQAVIHGRLEVVEDALGEARRARELTCAGANSRRSARDASHSGIEIQALVEKARSLAEYCFEEDLDEAACLDKDTVTLLTEVSADGSRSLCGYLCHRTYPAPRAELHISRLAVDRQLRGRGHAKLLMRWIMSRAARTPQAEIAWITLSALHSAVSFYDRLGFKVAPPREEPKEGGDPQTWMELRKISAVTLDTKAVSKEGAGPAKPQTTSASDVDMHHDVSGPYPSEPVVELPPKKVVVAEDDIGVTRMVARWQDDLSPEEMKKRIQEIAKLLKSSKKKNPILTEEERDQLQDEMDCFLKQLAALDDA